MKIIDFECKGNVVRFYLGDNDCNDYWGDDWNDAPYEHNAGTVYDRFVKGYKDLVFPFDSLVLEPCNGAWNSEYAKSDMIDRRVPCIIVVPPEVVGDSWRTDDFHYWVASDNIQKFFFGDQMEADVIKQTT